MSLSNRLQTIVDFIEPNYHHIWDTCCDHGFLGKALCNVHPASTIHFVDIAKHIMLALEHNLKTRFPKSNWLCHTISVNALPIVDYPGRHLVIIAGVGGDLAAEFVSTIQSKYPTRGIDFIICPVHHSFVLRKQLIELDFRLLKETLVEENNRFYEIIYISKNSAKLVSPVGESIWQNTKPDIALKYLKRLVSHYEKVATHKVEFKPALNEYLKITNKLKSLSNN